MSWSPRPAQLLAVFAGAIHELLDRLIEQYQHRLLRYLVYLVGKP